MEYVASIQTDLNGYPRSEKLIVKQGDTGMRYVVVTLLSDGVPVSVGTDVTISIAMTKPDGTQVVAEDNIERLADGKLKIKIIPQMTVVAGAGTMDITLYKGAEQISTATFDVLIYPSAMSMPAVASSNEYQALLSALAQIGAAVAAEETRKQSENKREENESIRNQNEVGRNEAFRQQSLNMWDTVNSAVASANEVTNTVQQKLDNGELVGPQGPQGLRGPQGPAGPQGPQGNIDGIRSAGIYYSSTVANSETTKMEYSTIENWFPSGCQFYGGDLIIANGNLFQITGQGSSGLDVIHLCVL